MLEKVAGRANRSGRASPMAPDDRRAAIVEATVPLLRTRGWHVTTREIATAAGVAEGTIFSVFVDKEALLVAALEAAIDPSPTVGRLAAIDRALPIEARLTTAVGILGEMFDELRQLIATLQQDEVRRRLPPRAQELFPTGVLASLFDPAPPDLAVEPAVAGQALVALTMGGTIPMAFATPLTTDQIVALVLDGVRRPC